MATGVGTASVRLIKGNNHLVLQSAFLLSEEKKQAYESASRLRTWISLSRSKASKKELQQ